MHNERKTAFDALMDDSKDRNIELYSEFSIVMENDFEVTINFSFFLFHRFNKTNFVIKYVADRASRYS